MHGQHGSKCFTVAAAVVLLFGSALISLAQARGATASAAPTAVSSAAPRITPGASAIPTPTATVTASPTSTAMGLPASTATPRSTAAATSAPLSKVDHELLISNSPGPSRIDHVLIIQARPSPSPNGAGTSASIPQAASRPEAHQTPGQAASSLAPAAQPQPVAARTPSSSPAVANNVPYPAATPKLSSIDHVLMVSVHPPGSPGSAAATDHAFVAGDHLFSDSQWLHTPGHELLASLDVPPDHHLTEGEELSERNLG